MYVRAEGFKKPLHKEGWGEWFLIKAVGYWMDHPSFCSIGDVFYCPISMSRQGVRLG